jgi:Zn-dependent peptidase ImmA (M78 family)/transcriptional regulator with XRE-family HTH domain
MVFSRSRLTLARLRRGLTRRGLAEAAHMSEKTLSSYERGTTAPPDETIALFARVLRFPTTFFYRQELDIIPESGVSFRALSRTSARQRDRALAGGSLALELTSWIDARFHLPKPDIPNIRPETDPEAAALAMRTQWSLGDNPISNMVHLLEWRGVRVYSLAEECEEVDAFSVWRMNQPFVFLNTLKSGEHSRFDAAHELGHLALHRHGTPSGQRAEYEANRFASAFLMPKTGIVASISKNPTLEFLLHAKKAWGVSLVALVYRLNELDMLSPWYHRALSVEIQRLGYRKREPSPEQREMSQVLEKVFDALRADDIKRADLAAQLGWPIEELNALVFQLVLSGLPAGRRGQQSETGREKPAPPQLRLLD